MGLVPCSLNYMSNVPSGKIDFPPLLEVGKHIMTIEELESLCLSGFPKSQTRQQILDRLRQVIEKISSANIDGELWVDGSLLTKKNNPNDSDVVLRLDGSKVENFNDDQKKIIDWLCSDLKTDYLCDSYFFASFPEDHQYHEFGKERYEYWERYWGRGRDGSEKGFVIIVIGGGV